MPIRAKFKVISITRQAYWNGGGEMQTIKLQPVTSGSEENRQFYAATPSGEINLSVVPVDIGKQFDIGGEYYVDFTPAVA